MARQLPDDLSMLARFYQRWEPQEDQRRQISDDLKELFAEGKANGFNPKAMRKAFAERYRLDHQTVQQREAAEATDEETDLYLSALARVREGDDDQDDESTNLHIAPDTNSPSDRPPVGVAADAGSDPASEAGEGGDALPSPAEIHLAEEGSRPNGASGGVEPQGGGSDDGAAPGQDESARIAPDQSTAAPIQPETANELQKAAGATIPSNQPGASPEGSPEIGRNPEGNNSPVAPSVQETQTSPSNVTPFTPKPHDDPVSSKGLRRHKMCLNLEVCAGNWRDGCHGCRYAQARAVPIMGSIGQ